MTSAPKQSIPTGLAWRLLESIIGGKPLERMAKIAAQSDAFTAEAEEKARSRYSKLLHGAVNGRKVRLSSQVEFLAAAKSALENALPKEQSSRFLDRVRNAGPFTALAAVLGPEDETPAYLKLLDFSRAMDGLGAAFSEATEQHDFAGARELLLGAERLGAAYWEFPEGGAPDAEINLTALRGANNWDQLTRAATPMVFNVTLSWLSLLDIAALAPGRFAGADFSLFQPLVTQPGAALGPPGAVEADRRKLPVANLIRMLEAITEEINAELQRRKKPPARKMMNKGEQAGLRVELKVFKRHDLLSADQFVDLLRRLRPDTKPKGDERCGFDIWSLLLATNLFSLLTPRNAGAPLSDSRRKAPEQIICFPGFEPGYMRWWKSNQAGVAGSTQRPRPLWLTSLQAEIENTNQGH